MRKNLFCTFLIIMLCLVLLTSCGYSGLYKKLNGPEQKIFNTFKKIAGARTGKNYVYEEFYEFKILEVEEQIGDGYGYIVRVSFPNENGVVKEHSVLISVDSQLDGLDILHYAYPDEYSSFSDSKIDLYMFDIEVESVLCINKDEVGYCECNDDIFNNSYSYQNYLIVKCLQERRSNTKPTNVNSEKIIKTWDAYIQKYAK